MLSTLNGLVARKGDSFVYAIFFSTVSSHFSRILDSLSMPVILPCYLAGWSKNCVVCRNIIAIFGG